MTSREPLPPREAIGYSLTDIGPQEALMLLDQHMLSERVDPPVSTHPLSVYGYQLHIMPKLNADGAEIANWLITQDLADEDETGQFSAAAEEARARLYITNLPLVIDIAKRFYPPVGTDIMDLIQEGNISLQYTLEKFDPRTGPLEKFAGWWIRQGIRKFIRKEARDYSQSPIKRGVRLSRLDPPEYLEMDDLGAVSTPDFADQAVSHVEALRLLPLLDGLDDRSQTVLKALLRFDDPTAEPRTVREAAELLRMPDSTVDGIGRRVLDLLRMEIGVEPTRKRRASTGTRTIKR